MDKRFWIIVGKSKNTGKDCFLYDFGEWGYGADEERPTLFTTKESADVSLDLFTCEISDPEIKEVTLTW